jgi:hypothetical protein
MRYNLHLALDRYGAECLGKFWSLKNSMPLDGSEIQEHNAFIWAGIREVPKEKDYWSEKYPPWDDSFPIPYDESKHGKIGLDLKRKFLAEDVRASILGKKESGETINLPYKLPEDLVGANVQYSVAITICLSLAEPASSAILLGFLSAFGELKRRMVLEHNIYVFAGIGAASGPTEPGMREEHLRALSAQALHDLNSFANCGKDAPFRACPIYVIGERPFQRDAQRIQSHRRDQVSIAAINLLGLTRFLIHEHEANSGINQFMFKNDRLQGVSHASRSYDSSHPFSPVGAYAVRVDPKLLSSMVAAKLAKDLFETFKCQPSSKDIEECSKLDVDDSTKSFLDQSLAKAVGFMWDEIMRSSKIALKPQDNKNDPSTWFDIDYIKVLFDSIFKDRHWQLIVDGYGWDRFQSIPLEDWIGALDELIQIIEKSYVPWRKQQISNLNRNILLSFLGGLQKGLDNVFSHTYEKPVDTYPHRLAQAFIGLVSKSLKDSSDKCQILLKKLFYDSEDKSKTSHDVLNALYEQMRSSFAKVPSPVAVFFRLIPITIIGILVVILMPLNLGPLNSSILRLVSGLGLGLILSEIFYVFNVVAIKRRLKKYFMRWFEYLKAVLQEEDKKNQFEAYKSVIEQMQIVLKWYFEGDPVISPIPIAFGIPTKASQGSLLFPVLPDTLAPQTVLRDFKPYLESAAGQYAVLETKLIAKFQTSLVETVLPEISPAKPDKLKQEYETILSAGGCDDPIEGAMNIMHQFGETAKRQYELLHKRTLFPFTEFAELNNVPVWRRAFLIPSGEALMNTELRDASSAFIYLESLAQFIAITYADRADLSAQLTRYLSDSHAGTLSGTTLNRSYFDYSVPSVETSGGQRAHYLLACNAADHLGVNIHHPNLYRLIDGMDTISLYLQADLFMSAQDLVFYPNKENPATPLGQSYKSCLSKSKPEELFLPVIMPCEEVS